MAQEGFSAEERAAMKERARELKAAKSREDGERDVLAKIAEMERPDRDLAEKIHGVVTGTAPSLAPKTWYGMPAYAREGRIVCFFQPALKFATRYATFGFNEDARLDDGVMWPTSYALTGWNAEVEQTITSLVRKAIG